MARIVSLIPSLPRVVQDAGRVDPLDVLGVEPERSRRRPCVGADGPRVLGGARMPQVDRPGEQQHGRQPQLLRLLTQRSVLRRAQLDLLQHERGVVCDRHQHGQLGVIGPASAERLIDRHDPEDVATGTAQRQQQRVLRAPRIDPQ